MSWPPFASLTKRVLSSLPCPLSCLLRSRSSSFREPRFSEGFLEQPLSPQPPDRPGGRLQSLLCVWGPAAAERGSVITPCAVVEQLRDLSAPLGLRADLGRGRSLCSETWDSLVSGVRQRRGRHLPDVGQVPRGACVCREASLTLQSPLPGPTHRRTANWLAGGPHKRIQQHRTL